VVREGKENANRIFDEGTSFNTVT